MYFGDLFVGLCAETAGNALTRVHGTDLFPPGYLLLFKIGNLNAF